MREKLNPYHIGLLMYLVQSGVLMFSLPRLTAEHFGTNGWISIVIASALVCMNIGLFYIVYHMGQGQSVFDIMESSVSKFILVPMYAVIASIWSISGCLIGKQYMLMFQMLSFHTTPSSILKILFDILVYFLLIQGIYNIVKASTVFFYLTVWMPLLLLYHFRDIEWVRFTPFLFQGNTTAMAQGMVEIFASLLGYEVCLYLFPYVERNSKFFRAVLLGNLYTTFVYIFICVVSFGFFGFGLLLKLKFPLLDLLAFIELPFVERIENLLFVFFIFKMLMTTVICYWIAQLYLERIFTKAQPKILAFLLVIITYIVSNLTDVLQEVVDWLRYFVMMQSLLNFVIPIFLIFLLLVKRRQGVK
ncbi:MULTISPECIES: GerAB/ArcD/ProY family transporter [unclassified Paenibacillus]|uniref:GerAB/ArcD/ProY family transporter n=1 Tax=unclassified Paenibacillus TaxID=185978 RepID=UPI001AE60E08|nr:MULTISPECIES: GerAB/ArcD/ProY family transporter [unclassified Paenibacillus]MBP1156867.1 spore germination protein (amino acid permease) [Paenibacillus sp. PvP091]MBP1172394.1 spore germination protein (amino acid permease) [Paenibacillus sp. PvR098]MBP2438775.1 spore germination protein (amino acid permease) [Paenibacillus sp. PvP052]